MHGGGTVSGSQLVAFIASKACCAFAAEMQPNHRHGHQHHHQIPRSHLTIHGRDRGRGRLRSGKGSGGASGSGSYGRTSMIWWSSSSVTTTGRPARLRSEERRGGKE